VGRAPGGASPLAAFQDRIACELASDAISYACTHPADAARLYLPPRILCCADCSELAREAAALHAAECAICSAPTALPATCWVTGRVLVMALICETCGATGNPAALWN